MNIAMSTLQPSAPLHTCILSKCLGYLQAPACAQRAPRRQKFPKHPIGSPEGICFWVSDPEVGRKIAYLDKKAFKARQQLLNRPVSRCCSEVVPRTYGPWPAVTPVRKPLTPAVSGISLFSNP